MPLIPGSSETRHHRVFNAQYPGGCKLARQGGQAVEKCFAPGAPRRQYQRVGFRDKIIGWDRLAMWRTGIRNSQRRLVVTNGCFDLIHLGHVAYLENARKLGDVLLVGINSDASVRELKGSRRPLNREEDRACVVAGLESVDAVCIFSEPSAARFLLEAQPDVYVKGGDYTVDTLNAEERRVVEQVGGSIVVLPLVAGRSTTALLHRIVGE